MIYFLKYFNCILIVTNDKKFSQPQRLPFHLLSQTRPSQKTISNLLNRQRSHTKAEGIQRTPSTQHINNYIDNLQQRPTDKKRSNYSPAYPAPVLLEQNKTLLAENREMAMLIHERNLQV